MGLSRLSIMSKRACFVILMFLLCFAGYGDQLAAQNPNTVLGDDTDGTIRQDDVTAKKCRRSEPRKVPATRQTIVRTPTEDSARGITSNRIRNLFEADSESPIEINEEALPASNSSLQSYISERCDSCLAREEAKLMQISKIKRDLVTKLGFRALPNVTKADMPKLPKTNTLSGILRALGYVSDGPRRIIRSNTDTNEIYDHSEQTDEEVIDEPETVVVLASAPDRVHDTVNSGQQSSLLSSIAKFKFSPETILSDVQSATLHFFIKPVAAVRRKDKKALKNKQPFQVVLKLFRIPGNADSINDIITQKPELQPSSQLFLPLNQNGTWHQLNVTSLIQSWFRKPPKAFQILLEGKYVKRDVVEDLIEQPSEEGENRMYMEITTMRPNSRTKRDGQRFDCTVNSGETRCCRYPLIVDFEQMGWDWIIAPKRYYAHYCAGACPALYLQKGIHTHIAQQRGGYAGPCCTASDLAGIQMIYFNEQKEMLISNIPGMVVTRCACS